MAVTEFNTYSASGGYRAGFQEYSVEYRVITDDVNDGPDVIWAHASAPGPPSGTYVYGNDSNPDAYVGKDRMASLLRADGSRKYWKVVIPFTTDPDKQANEEEEENQNPLDKPWKWSGSWINYQRAKEKDRNGRLYGSTAGEPFDPPKMVDDPRNVIRAEKNFANHNISLWNAFRAKLNSAPIWGLPARTIKIRNISWTQIFFQAGDYYKVLYEMEVLDDDDALQKGWDDKAIDMGFNGLIGGQLERITLPNPEIAPADGDIPVPEPWLLDGAGAPLTSAQVQAGTTAAVPQGGFFEWYDALPFAALGFPPAIGI